MEIADPSTHNRGFVLAGGRADTCPAARTEERLYRMDLYRRGTGQMDNFKQVVSKVIAAVAQEPGTLMYEWSFRQDQKTFDVIELYQSSEAALAHVKHVVAEFGKDLGQVQKGLQLTIYGTPDAQVKQAVEGFNPVYQIYFEGFIR